MGPRRQGSRDPHDGLQTGKLVDGVVPWRSPVNIDKIKIPSADFQTLPADLPMSMVVERISGIFGLADQPTHEVHGLIGHAIGLDFYTKGHGTGTFVEIVVNRDPNAMYIEVNGEEVFAWVEDGASMPLKISELIEEERRLGHEFVDQVDLQPGDEVLEGNVVVREGDEVIDFDDEDDDDVILFDEELDNDDFIE